MKRIQLFALAFVALIFFSFAMGTNSKKPVSNRYANGKFKVAPTPPMGWNSFDAYDCRINEQEFKQTVDFMANNLLEFGWNYAVIDYVWFNDEPGNWDNPTKRFGHPNIRFGKNGQPLDTMVMDNFGRLLPSVKRFPSAANGKGFKAIADYVHSKGLKFGIHIMRGIPREAVYNNLPIKGTKYFAKDIAEPFDTCEWQNNLYGVDASKPGAQEYYNSIFQLYAAWGVDFIKADDTMYPPYHKGEIELIQKAIQNCGRPMVLSLSCGEAPLGRAEHLKQNATMWRVSADFWDKWKDLSHSFDLLNTWSSHVGPDSWPDADMIPFGHISMNNRPHGPDRMSLFTPQEHKTLMTLFSIARSPLIIGADFLTTPKETIDTYFRNAEVIAVNQNAKDSRQVFKNDKYAVWTATDPKTGDRYLALFNLSDTASKVRFDLEDESLRGTFKVRDLWSKKDSGTVKGTLEADLGIHDAALFRLTPIK